MRIRLLIVLLALSIATAPVLPQSRRSAPYAVVQIERFVAEQGVDFPLDYQIVLVEDIVRETQRASKGIEIIREGESIPLDRATMRISGTITEFKPGSRAKRYLIGFGAGATVVKAHVRFTDAASGEILLEKDLKGVTWTGFAGGSSQSAADRLGRYVASAAKLNRLIPAR